MTSVCLLGGTGYIGKYLEEGLKERGFKVTVVSRSTNWSYEDFLEDSTNSFDVYVHLIGNSSDNFFNNSDAYLINHKSLSESLERFERDKDSKKFIFFSTLYTQIDREAKASYLSPYIQSKKVAERVMADFSSSSSKSFSVFRPAVVFKEARGLLGVLAKFWNKGLSLKLGGNVGVPLVRLDQILDSLEDSILSVQKGLEEKNLIGFADDFLSTHKKPEILGFPEPKPRVKLTMPFWILKMLASLGHSLRLPFNKYFLYKLTSYSNLMQLKDE